MENNETINPGDTVRCIRGPEKNTEPRLVVGNLYIVNAIHQCVRCKEVLFDVGLTTDDLLLRCCCGAGFCVPKNVRLCYANRFVKDRNSSRYMADVKPISYTKIIEKEKERILEN